MKKTALFALLFLFCLAPVLYAETDAITLKQSAKGEWKMLDRNGQQVGTLRLMEEGTAYSIQLPGGEYMGIIFKTGQYQKPGRRPLVTPDDARLYLDTWEAIQKLK